MALPWPHGTPTLPRPLSAVTPSALRSEPGARTAGPASSPLVARALELVTSPVTALVVMLLGLALLFVLPFVGLPFVALVVLPAVVYHLRAEHRVRFRRTRS